MPKAVSTPARRDSIRLLRVTIAKSGPGLIIASTVMGLLSSHPVNPGSPQADLLAWLQTLA
jgi:hypothetical protein